MKFLFFAGGTSVTGMEVALLSLMARLDAIGHRAVAIVSGWNDGAYVPMLDAAASSITKCSSATSTATIRSRRAAPSTPCVRRHMTFAPSQPRFGPTG
jgi:hypothetical protein